MSEPISREAVVLELAKLGWTPDQIQEVLGPPFINDQLLVLMSKDLSDDELHWTKWLNKTYGEERNEGQDLHELFDHLLDIYNWLHGVIDDVLDNRPVERLTDALREVEQEKAWAAEREYARRAALEPKVEVNDYIAQRQALLTAKKAQKEALKTPNKAREQELAANRTPELFRQHGFDLAVAKLASHTAQFSPPHPKIGACGWWGEYRSADELSVRVDLFPELTDAQARVWESLGWLRGRPADVRRLISRAGVQVSAYVLDVAALYCAGLELPDENLRAVKERFKLLR